MSITLTDEQKREVYLQVVREKNAAIRAANPEAYAKKNRENAKKFYQRNREAILEKQLLKRVEAGATPCGKSLAIIARATHVDPPPESSRRARERRYQERKTLYSLKENQPQVPPVPDSAPQAALAEP